MSGGDPWAAEFKRAPQLDRGPPSSGGADPWAEFNRAPQHDAAPAQAAPAPRGAGFLQPLVDTVHGALDQVKGDFSDDYAQSTAPRAGGLMGAGSELVNSILHPFAPGGMLRSGKEIFDAVGAVASPLAGAMNVVADPIEKATSFNGRPGLNILDGLAALGPEAEVLSGAMAAGRAARLASTRLAPKVARIVETHPPEIMLHPNGDLTAQGQAVAESQGVSHAAVQDGYAQVAAAQADATAARPASVSPPPRRGIVANVTAPLRAAASRTSAEAQAGDILATRASDPAAAAAALEAPGEIVPGSEPTTFQQTGDLGLGTLEREVATRNPDKFAARRADQNEARVSALKDVQAGGDPNDMAKALRAQFDDLDAQTEAHVASATADARARAADFGGNVAPEDSGSSLRAVLTDAETTAKQRERGLWKAVDPEGDLTGNVTPTVSAAKDIAGSIGRVAKPMTGEEASIFDAAQSLPALSPVRDLIDLRGRVASEMRAELMAAGKTPTYARLSQLRGAIQDNLAHSIGQSVAQEDAAVARGVLQPEDTIAQGLRAWADEFYANRTQARAVGESGVGDNAGGGSAPLPRLRGAEGETGGAPRGASGDPRLSGDAGAPTFDTDAGERLAAAAAATRENATTLRSGPVGQALARAGTNDQFRLPDGRVASKFFHPGPTGFSDMQGLFHAAGTEATVPILHDYAATSLRRAAMRDDGTIDPAKFARWKDAFQHSLRALPEESRARFATAAKAGEAVADATAQRVAALKDFQAGEIGRVLKLDNAEDVTRAVGRALTSRTARADMISLAKATVGNPEAKAGLRQAAADFITGRLIGNTEAGTSGVGLIKADDYQTFFKENRAALNIIFKPEEVRSMDAIAQDIQRSKRSETAVRLPGGSNTAQDYLGAKREPAPLGRKTALDVIAATVGGLAHGPLGAAAGVFGSELLQAWHAAGIARVDQLLTEAMLHPEIAAQLLKKANAGRLTPAQTVPLARAIRKATMPQRAAVAVASAYAEAHQAKDREPAQP